MKARKRHLPAEVDSTKEQPLSEAADDSETSSKPDVDESDSSDESSDGDGSESYPEVSEDEAEAEGDSDDETVGDGEVVDVDFEFFDVKETDFHGLKALLTNYLDGQPFSSSGLVDHIIAHPAVCTVLKTGEEEAPLGLATLLHLRQLAAQPFILELFAFLEAGAPDEASKAALRAAWAGKRSALMVNVRLLNCPPQLGPPLQSQLFSEVGWALEDATDQAERDTYTFDQFVMVDRVYVDPGEQSKPSSSGKPNPSKKSKTTLANGKQTIATSPPLIYTMPESEFYHQRCSWSYIFPTDNRPVAKGELQPYRLVMMVTAKEAAAARKKLGAEFGHAASEDA